MWSAHSAGGAERLSITFRGWGRSGCAETPCVKRVVRSADREAVNTSSKPWRVLVTGAGGFVGAAVCTRLLEEGHTVVAACRPGGPPLLVAGSPLEQLEADLRDPDAFRPLVRAARPDMAVHLAAVRAVVRSGGVDPDLVAVNALSGMRLAEELGRVGAARLVSCGSSSEYGSATTTLVESASLRPDDAYGATKAAGAHLALAAARAAGVEAVHLRPFSVYGAGEREERLVAGLLRALVEGRHVALTDGRQARDFVYVDDVAGAVVRALTARDVDGEAINVGTGVETTVRHLALLAADIAGADRSLLGFGELPYRPAERFGWRASTRKALDLLRWQATTPLTVGLEHTLDAMRASLTREANARRRSAA